ncbi:proline/glycine betaine ABC transporter permease [Nocardioides sp. AE5]|uniref:ABC transporter permease n=1 Tax=Nocardioides sp. AE5 TaxID=2962573 RepID=UPI00288103B9|nr:proline/glycine betaine ABC transporter permease [Nocardioides sp. AE5]MDT0202338.1 proline/glycine betaine ABC transporter permease [Nocardioides sp. AE5]
MQILDDWFDLDDKVDGIPRFLVGERINEAFGWIKEHWGQFLRSVGNAITDSVDWIISVLNGPAPIFVAVLFALLAWLAKDWKLATGTLLGMVFIISMQQWHYAMETLALVAFATVVALLISIPLGILAARWDWFSRLVRPVMDLMQTMPAFVWLVPVVSLFGLNVAAGVAATVIFALPPGVRLTELGIRQVDPEVIEAGHAFGAKPGQILRETQLPLAMPTVMAGINQVIMLALSMAVIAGLVGAEGLGGQVTKSISRLNIGLGFEAGLSVVVLAIFLDRVTAAVGQRNPGQGRFSALGGWLFGRRRAEADDPDSAATHDPTDELTPAGVGGGTRKKDTTADPSRETMSGTDPTEQ